MRGAEQGQLAIDDFLEVGRRYRTTQKNAVYEKPGCARYADLTSLFQVGFDFGFEFAAVEARLKRFLIQIQRPGAGEQFSAIQLGLLRVQGIVILPKFPLLARASSRFGRPLSLGVDFPQREVEVGELYPAAVLGEEFVQSALALLAKGALKVRELDNRDRGFGIPFHPRRIVRDIYAGRPQQNRDIDLRPQRVGVNLASFLQLKLLKLQK